MSTARIEDSLTQLTAAITQHEAVVVDKEGYWRIEGEAIRTIRLLTDRETRRDQRVVDSLARLLDRKEANGDATHVKETLAAATTAIERYRECDVSKLARRALALQYRYDKETEPQKRAIPNQLIALANRWKLSQVCYDHGNLGEQELLQLQRVAHYPGFAALLCKDSATRTAFFKWTLRDGLNPDIFIQFPNTATRLSRAYLDKRVGYLGGAALSLVAQPGKKDVTLLCEGKPVSILSDKNQMTLSKDYQLTVGEAFAIFHNKNLQVGNLEFTAKGITNWHPTRHGSWVPATNSYECIDLDREHWWEQLPRFRTLSRDEVKALYNVTLQPGQGAIAACAARQTPDLNAVATHGWMEVLLPRGDQHYDLLPFGKYADHFPAAWHEYVRATTITSRAVIEYPEENTFRSNRQHARYTRPLSPEQIELLMTLIRNAMQRARNGNLTFQALGDNCSHWVQSLFDHLWKEDVPRLYDAPYYEPRLSGIGGLVFGPLQSIPFESLKDLSLRLVLRLFGADIGIHIINEEGKSEYRAMTTIPFWDSGRGAFPPRFIERVRAGAFSHA